MQEVNSKKRYKSRMLKDKERREERRLYMKEYMKVYNKRTLNANLSGYVYVSLDNLPVIIKKVPVNEEKLEIEDEYCSFFGCGRVLTLVEKLCGSKCTKHMKVENAGVEYR